MNKQEKAVVQAWRALLATDNQWAVRGLLRIHKEQLGTEADLHTSLVRNGLGFTRYDAETLCILADRLKTKGYLVDSDLSIVRALMPKYAGQLLRLVIRDGTPLEILTTRVEVADPQTLRRGHHVSKRPLNPHASVSWSRKTQANGRIRYVFVAGGKTWTIKFLRTTMTRDQIAMHLRSQRKQFRKYRIHAAKE